jgi:hypothetical protein
MRFLSVLALWLLAHSVEAAGPQCKCVSPLAYFEFDPNVARLLTRIRFPQILVGPLTPTGHH